MNSTPLDTLQKLFKFSQGYPAVFDDEYEDTWKKFRSNKTTLGVQIFDAIKFMAMMKQSGINVLDKPVKIGNRQPSKRVTAEDIYYKVYITDTLDDLCTQACRGLQNAMLFKQFKVAKSFVSTGSTPELSETGSPITFVQTTLVLHPRTSRISLDAALNEVTGTGLWSGEVPIALRDNTKYQPNSKSKVVKSRLNKGLQVAMLPNVARSPYGWYVTKFRDQKIFFRRASDALVVRILVEFDDPCQLQSSVNHEKQVTNLWKQSFKQKAGVL